MSRDVIPIHPAAPAAEPGLTGNAPPLLRELAELLRRLIDAGETSAIDLSALPLTLGDLDWLRRELGTGEIAVTLQASGESTLAETAFPGIWWITHRNEQGVVTSQFLEVTYVPELVKSPAPDVAAGLESLVLRVSEL